MWAQDFYKYIRNSVILPIETKRAAVDKAGDKQVFAGIVKEFETSLVSLAKQPWFDNIVG